MADHGTPVHSAKLLLPVVIIGMLILMSIMYKFGGDASVHEYHKAGTQNAPQSH